MSGVGNKLFEECGGKLVTVVRDNYSGVRLGIEKFVQNSPRVFQIHCAAHSLQLLLGDLSKLPPLNLACRMGQAILQHSLDVDNS